MPVSPPSDPQAAALLNHVLSQMQQNISFLASNNYISSAEASDLTARLTAGPAPIALPTPGSVATSMSNLSVGPARRNIPPPPPRSSVQQARAVWAYNEDGREPNDLSFSSGEIVEIVDETNADWWTGKCRGKQGLFPSNHVEKIASSSGPSYSPPPVMPAAPSYYSPPAPPQYNTPPYNEKAAYQPPYQSSYNPIPVQPAPAQAPVQQEEPPKKSKFGKLGNTMATSAAGGVGFGAGAAIGSGIVNAIF
ncbi:SH3-domain-containing protein [Epithele typhae]|uniref:SH3-domain-containing protein n=1 Tax=Epithele typhae TaxID=378194 RepID=UPI0020082B1C|nr:SH3-domain-containing protein [Epithele typhae]KAH9945497.1 SH3-domain-containing protein [Epithele typhae]